MKKYTFIAHYKGNYYVSQYAALDLLSALNLWGEGLDKRIFSLSKRKKILRDIRDPTYFPIGVEGVDRIWEADYLSGKSFLILYIIETI